MEQAVVAIDYASNATLNDLSPASWATFKTAVDIVRTLPDMWLLWGNVADESAGMRPEMAEEWRRGFIAKRAAHHTKTMSVSCTNSIDECRNMRDLLRAQGIALRSLTVVCDTYHARRLRMIYQHFYPDTHIIMRPIYCPWSPNHAYWVQRRWWRWAAGNAVHFAMMKMLGVESPLLQKIRQPAVRRS